LKVKYTLIFIAFVFFGCSKKKQNIESEKTISDKGVYYYNLTKQEKYSDYQRINFLNKAFGLTYNLQNTKESRNLLSDIVFQYYNFEINDGFNFINFDNNELLNENSYQFTIILNIVITKINYINNLLIINDNIPNYKLKYLKYKYKYQHS
jgi:hypothetical protein